MRVIFAGTPEFAAAALAAILAAGHQVQLVLTRADRPAGRGQAVQMSPVKQLALAQGIAVFQPNSLRDPEVVQALACVEADVMVVAAYGRILPQDVLRLPRLGCLNIHASVLPRWRGAAPIQRAVEAGDVQSGITIMQMDEGLDTGDMLLVRRLDIGPDENAGSLHDRLMALGARAIVEVLASIDTGGWTRQRQPQAGVTYARKIEKAESHIDWSESATVIMNKVRAFDPFPGCTSRHRESQIQLKFWRAQALTFSDESGPQVNQPAGTVLDDDSGRLVIHAGGNTALAVLELQKPGARRLPVREFLAGHRIRPGDHFE